MVVILPDLSPFMSVVLSAYASIVCVVVTHQLGSDIIIPVASSLYALIIPSD